MFGCSLLVTPLLFLVTPVLFRYDNNIYIIMNTIKISIIRDVKIPTRGTPFSAGLDFFVPNLSDNKTKTTLTTMGYMVDEQTSSIQVPPLGSIKIPTGVRAKIPHGYMLKACNKSGICTNTQLMVGAEVVDEDYQGEIHMHLINVSSKTVTITSGQKLVQFVLEKISYADVEVVEDNMLFEEESERGSGGFGSTGLK